MRMRMFIVLMLIGGLLGKKASAGIVDTVTNEVVREMKQAGKAGEVNDAVIGRFVKKHEQEFRASVDRQFVDAIKLVVDGFENRLSRMNFHGQVSIRFKCANGVVAYYCRFVKSVMVARLLQKKVGLALGKDAIAQVGDYIRNVIKNKELYRSVERLMPSFKPARYLLNLNLMWAQRNKTVVISFDLNNMTKGEKLVSFQGGQLPYPPFRIKALTRETGLRVKEVLAKAVEKQRLTDVKQGLKTAESLISMDEDGKALKRLREIEAGLQGLPGAEAFRRDIAALRVKAGNKKKHLWGVIAGVLAALFLLVITVRAAPGMLARRALRKNLPERMKLVTGWIEESKYVAAHKQLETMLKTDPENPALLQAKNRLDSLTEGDPEIAEQRLELRGNIQAHAQEVIEWIDRGSFVAAGSQLEKLLKIDPENPVLLELKTKLSLLTKGDAQGAEQRLMMEHRTARLREQTEALLKEGDAAGVERLRLENAEVFDANPGMQMLVQKAATIRIQAQKKRQLMPGLNEVKEEIEKGDPRGAMERLQVMLRDIPDFAEAKALMEVARQKVADMDGLKARAKALIAKGRVDAFLQRMKDLRAQGIADSDLYELERRVVNGKQAQAYTIRSGEVDGDIHVLMKTELTIGKLNDNDCVIMAPYVSRRHAVLVIRGDRVVVQDLGSKNGTEVAGRRIEPDTDVVVEDADKVTIGGEKALEIRVGHGTKGVEYVSVKKDGDAYVLLAGRYPVGRRGGGTLGELFVSEGCLFIDNRGEAILITGKRRHEINGILIEVETRDEA